MVLALIGHFPNQAVRRASGRWRRSACRQSSSGQCAQSQLVEQRPDVRAAQAQLHQASALIGVAFANRLPQLSLTAQYGTLGLTPAALFTPASTIWSLGAECHATGSSTALLFCIRSARPEPPMRWPTRNIATPCLTAFRNVADVLRALQLDAATLKAQQRAVRAASRHVRSDARPVSPRRHHLRGLCSTPNEAIQQARLALVQAQAARYADTAALFSGTWRRLVEPHRCGARSLEPPAATGSSSQRYSRHRIKMESNK